LLANVRVDHAGVGAAEEPLVDALERELACAAGSTWGRLACRGRAGAARAPRSPPWRSRQLVEQVGHLDGDARRVAALLVGARCRLLGGVAGQDRVGDRDAVVERDPRDRGAALVGDQLEVVGFATDDAADRDQRIVLVGVGDGVERAAELERAGNADVGDVGRRDAERDQLLGSRAGDAIGELGVEARLDDRDAELPAVEAGRLAAFSVAHGGRRPLAAPARRRGSR
jgi:hypothetical protein